MPMPSLFAPSESITLVASDTSPVEPPRASQDKSNGPATGGHESEPHAALPNGSTPEASGRNGKNVTGTISSGPYILNASLTSLANGRSSGSSFSVNSIPSTEHAPRMSKKTALPPKEPQPSPTASRTAADSRSNLAQVQTIHEASTPVQSLRTPSSPAQTRHRRAQSASNPSSPLAASPTPIDTSRAADSYAQKRLSVTSAQDGSTASLGRPSLNIQRPPSLRLQHRHTLQVPKLAGGRGSRDFSFSNTNASEDAITATATGSAIPRASVNLVRRTTRSVHSDIYLDEIPQDADAARWTETVRQKRASRRRRKEEEEDDRVMVGTKVDQNHVNWVTAYNMLTGIRFTVSRTNAKMDRELSSADFDARHKFSFDITGNELTPSAKYDFKFKDYAPWVFRHLRARFHIDPADYLVSLTSKYILSELGSPGKSGSFFYFSRDYKYIIKTIHHGEHKLLRKILRDYYAHVGDNPNTLISQFYGLHRVKIPYGRKIHFVVMNNLFPPHRDIHQTFDLKGSTIGREFREEELEHNPRATLKDLNWLRRDHHLEFGPAKKQVFIDQMRRDVALLRRLQIMDYSLLVGIHDLTKGNEENLRDKTLQVFQPGSTGERGDPDAQQGSLMRTPSKLESARKARELREIMKREKPMPIDQNTLQMTDGHAAKKNFTFYSEDGGFRASHEDGSPGEEVYYLGVIDCLTHYGFRKRVENLVKGMMQNKAQISAVPPEEYGQRFLDFMIGVTMPREAAEARSQSQAHAQSQAQAALSEKAAPTLKQPQRLPREAHRAAASAAAGAGGAPMPTSAEATVSHAERHAARTAEDADVPPDRSLSSSGSEQASTERGDRPTITLPVLEEVGEAGSTGSRSARSARSREAVGENGLFAPLRSADGASLAPVRSGGSGAPPLGGQPPPTPPKDVPVRTPRGAPKPVG